jgi:hypothetical protein
MRFITRELYAALQAGSNIPEEQAAREWDERCEALRVHLESVLPKLPENAPKLTDGSFHDGVIQSASRPDSWVVELVIDARAAAWGPRGVFQLKFYQVREVSGLHEMVGDIWLYSELDVHPEGGFELSVLLHRSEFRIAAGGIELSELPHPKPEATLPSTPQMELQNLKGEPRGETYRGLIRLAERQGLSAMLITRLPEWINEEARELLLRLRPFLTSEREAAEWPGTKLHGGLARLGTYRLVEESTAVLCNSVQGLFEWQHPSRLEDLCLLRQDGTPLLVSIAHEDDGFFQVESDELDLIRREVPGIANLL